MTPGESGRARRSSAAISTPERPAAPVSAALPARPPAPGPSRQDTRRRGGASRHAARDEGTLALADKRYPRPRWIRALRRAAKRAPLMLLLYPLAALLHLGLLVLQQGTAALHAPATYYEASFLTWGLRVAAAYPVLAVVPLLVVLDLAAMYAVARRDERREQEVLEARILDERLTQTTMAAVRLPTAGPARPTQPPRLERMPEEGGRPQLYGPPDDLGRLPEPPGFVGRARELAWLGERIGATLERGGGGVLAVTDATGAGGVGVSTLVGRALRQA